MKHVSLASPASYILQLDISCKCCGNRHAHPDFLLRLNALFSVMRRAYSIHTFYRCAKHKQEEGRETPSAFNKGRAAILYVPPKDTHKFVRTAVALDLTVVRYSSGGVMVELPPQSVFIRQ